MKSFLMRMLVTSMLVVGFFSVNAQLNWNVTSDVTYQNTVGSCLGLTDEGIGLVTFVAEQAAFQNAKYKVQFRYYDDNMVFKTMYDLPENAPSRLNIVNFNDYTVIYGTNWESPQGNGNAEIIFLDGARQEVLRKEWKLAGSSHGWANESITYMSSDSLYFIVDFVENCYPDKPSLADFPQIHQITVFNSKLETVWEGSVDFESLLNKQSLDIGGMDYTPDGKVLVYGVETIERKRHIVAYELTDSKVILKKVADEIMPAIAVESDSYRIDMQAYVSRSNEFTVFCAGNMDGETRNMLYVRQNLDNASDKNVAYYLVDRKFAATFPEFRATNDSFPLLHKFCFTEDGLVVGGEFIKQEHSGSILSSLFLYKFGKDGRIIWTTRIRRELYLGVISGQSAMNLFSSGDDLIVFYYDKPENVQSNALIPGKRQYTTVKVLNETCLAAAKINSDGKILYRKVINPYKANSVLPDNSQIFSLGDDHFIVRGEKEGKNAFSSFSLE